MQTEPARLPTTLKMSFKQIQPLVPTLPYKPKLYQEPIEFRPNEIVNIIKNQLNPKKSQGCDPILRRLHYHPAFQCHHKTWPLSSEIEKVKYYNDSKAGERPHNPHVV